MQPLFEIAVFRPFVLQLLFEFGVAREKLVSLGFQLVFALGATHQEPVMLSFPITCLPLELDSRLLGQLNNFAGKWRPCLPACEEKLN